MNNISFCDAIARMEGWLVPSSRCRRNHNPGNIRYGTFAKRHGAIGTDGSFAKFKDDAAGFVAMCELLEASYTGLTVAKALAKYAPSTENNTQNYINDICAWTGFTPETVLTSNIINVGGFDGTQKLA